MLTVAKKRVQGITVAVNKDVNDDLDAFVGDRTKKKSLVSAVLKWFLVQPPPVRRVVLDEVDPGLEAAYAAWLEERARGLREKAAAAELPQFVEKATKPRSGRVDERSKSPAPREGGALRPES